MNAESMFNLLTNAASGVLRTSIAASILAALILLAQFVFHRQISSRVRSLLWLLLLLRLATPAAIPLPIHRAAALPLPSTDFADKIADSGNATQTIAPAAISAARRINWPLVLSILWLAGFAAFTGKILWASLRLRKFVNSLQPLNDATLNLQIEHSANLLHLRRSPTVLAAPLGSGPALVGVLHPRLLIPRQCLQLPNSELRLIVLHELAHQRRADVAIGWIAAILQAIHWFNPLLWFALARMRADCELACDEIVLAAVGESNENDRNYGLMLLKIAEMLSTRPPTPGTACIVTGAHTLKRRIAMIATYDRRQIGTTRTIAIAMVVLAVGWVYAGNSPVALPAATSSNTLAVDNSIAGSDVRARLLEARHRELDERDKPPLPSAIPANSAAFADDSHAPVPDPTNPLAAEADDKVVAKLQQNLPQLKFQNISFNDAMDFFRDTTGLNIAVDLRSLESVGIDPGGSNLDLDLKNVPAGVAFEQVLRDASPTAPLDFEIANGIVRVSTADELNREAVTRVYDVSDLLDSHTSSDELCSVVTANVLPGTWQAEHAEANASGHVEILGSKLIVTTNPRGQRLVVKFLQLLRNPIARQ